MTETQRRKTEIAKIKEFVKTRHYLECHECGDRLGGWSDDTKDEVAATAFNRGWRRHYATGNLTCMECLAAKP